MSNKVFILGATGSIGKSSLKSIKKIGAKLVGFSFNKNLSEAINIIKEFEPEYILTFDNESYTKLKEFKKSIYFGHDGLLEIINKVDKETKFINGIYGINGIEPSFLIGESGFDLILANKETIVMGSDIFTSLFKKSNLIPIDSEHWALFNLLRFIHKEFIKEYYITASGGALLKYNGNIEDVTLADIRKHPVWNMGLEITINSSTMANKGLEIIEAKELFKIAPDFINVIIHPEALVHSMVRLKSGVLISLISKNDMAEPIAGAIVYPDFYEEDFDISNKVLNFIPVDYKRYPMLELAYQVANKGVAYQICYTVANEFFVKEFISGNIKFESIYKQVYKVLSDFYIDYKINSMKDILKTINYCKDFIISRKR